MKLHKKNAFTLIELMIVIAIMFLILTFVYLPYVHYQEKIKIKQVVREVSQWISEARNMAINGFDETLSSTQTTTWLSWDNFQNKSIWLYFDNSGTQKNVMYFFAYPHTISKVKITAIEEVTENISIIEERQLPTGTEFNMAHWDWFTNMQNILFFFESISGSGSYYTFPGSPARTEISGTDILELDFSYKDSPSSVLNKTLKYDTRINISDF